ncbi:5969_t:CDS:2 [Paraglomus brasilianum]|uniref:5969_t:CDS:1 n=1 Tax=Paraglomus brasilianum TaxID=144538 RepID=A0A9N9C4Y6_9GLOM|nr:5969_t:CDS:2 [Paraglomus brasilianum]
MPPKQLSTSPKILTIRSRIAQEAHFIISEILPAKIVSLSSVDMYDNSLAEINETSVKIVSKKHRVEDMAVQLPILISYEKEIRSIHALLRNEISELVGFCGKMRLWATLLLPRFNNGNELHEPIEGNAIEDIIAELSRIENEGFAFLDSIVQYYNTRARLETYEVQAGTRAQSCDRGT